MKEDFFPKERQGCTAGCRCCGTVDRRTFNKVLGAGLLSMLGAQVPVMAGPFENAEFEKLVPADKKLSEAWVASLFDRGAPQVYTGEALKQIGMPVGGIGTGQLYLGGDGRLWHWDIFNQLLSTGAEHYANPMHPMPVLEQGFTIRVNGKDLSLDSEGFPGVTFRGEYPVGIVEYKGGSVPVEVKLESFSPFIPLNADDSSLPATILHFTVKNTGQEKAEGALTGRLENAVCLHTPAVNALHRNRVVQSDAMTFVLCSVEKTERPAKRPRRDVEFEDWSSERYTRWTVEGTAFGAGPVKRSEMPDYQGDVGGDTDRIVNSHASAPGSEVGGKDGATGKLTSRPFRIKRRFIQFWIGGGAHAGKTCLNLLVDGKVVHSATGRNDNRMSLQYFDVRRLKGKEAVIEIVDAETGGWGNIGVGRITFTDKPVKTEKLEEAPDYGTMGLGLLGGTAEICSGDAAVAMSDSLVAELGRGFSLDPGQSVQVSFLITWHFPNLQMDKLPGGRLYAARFPSALEVAAYIAGQFDRLSATTKLWRDTWYDSTLPWWFLDRTFLNTSILASSTCHRFKDGRFYGWEGVGCCAGTCGHVWQYAHAVARLFPELERDTRERVDFGIAMREDGAVLFRGEHNDIPAIDAQAGVILRALREHQMCPDRAFLSRNWTFIKKATEWLITKDENDDGIIESNQHNTLDTDWYGPVAWLSGMYAAALLAAAALSDEVGDAQFAARCRSIAEKGRDTLVGQLFDGEYFINKPDPAHADTINSGSGCEIDQVLGQSWAWQVDLGRVLPEKETLSALRSLWKYNFTPDVGPYREAHKPGRWYAMPGEAGLLMCTFPRTDWDYDKAKGKGADWAAGYFNECMNGFEYQVAGHMIWEGLLQEGLAVTRAVHDRYDASRRNPWNEVECGDHYARSMASYGVFLAACGFSYHGPEGRIGFSPRLAPEKFKAAFTSAEGWGSYQQEIVNKVLKAEIEVKYGSLLLNTLELTPPQGTGMTSVSLTRKDVAWTQEFSDGKVRIILAEPVRISSGEILRVTVS